MLVFCPYESECGVLLKLGTPQYSVQYNLTIKTTPENCQNVILF